MRVGLLAILAGLALSGAATAQDLCSNIRLSISEQIECRGRFANNMGDGDRAQIQRDYEDRIRRANDQLITPPILNSPPRAPVTSPTITPPPQLPAMPVRPASPRPPGSIAPAQPMENPPAGQIATPGGAAPGGNAAVPDLGAPNPGLGTIQPISPLPGNPTSPPTPKQ